MRLAIIFLLLSTTSACTNLSPYAYNKASAAIDMSMNEQQICGYNVVCAEEMRPYSWAQ